MTSIVVFKAVRHPLRACRALAQRILLTLRRRYVARYIDRSGLFDKEWYLQEYPDVAEGRADPLKHYVAFGAKEGRDPSSAFSTRGYLALHKDVEAANLNPFFHYIRHGLAEGRSTGLSVTALPEITLRDLMPAGRRRGVSSPLEVDIIIPVYAGADETKRCLESVLATVPLNKSIVRVVVVDDASPESDLCSYLAQLNGRIDLITNESNLGFVRSVNRGMTHTGTRDVILLNSDTEVAGDWIDRLAAHACADDIVGTVTPFSNNATICSYPTISGHPSLPAGETVASLDAAFREANRGRSADIPTAVGFCMYIKRACLDDIGLFDAEAYGRGYGEENDFCLRATEHGWRHVIAGDVFVFHKGEVSFGSGAQSQQRLAAKMLQARYPHYNKMISNFVGLNPLATMRIAATAARYRRGKRPVLLMVLHQLGGGTEKHVNELASQLGHRARCLALRMESKFNMVLTAIEPGEHLEAKLQAKNSNELGKLLRLFGVQRLHVHHALGFRNEMQGFLAEIGLPYDLTIHDYMLICPRIFLTRNAQEFCGEPDDFGCQQCLQHDPPPLATDILWWRSRGRELVEQAERVICPSQDAAARLARYTSPATLIVVPHEPGEQQQRIVRVPPLKPKMRLRVAVLGAMTRHKGGAFLLECVSACKAANLTIDLFVIGSFEPSLVSKLHALRGLVRSAGAYENSSVQKIIKSFDPHLIFYPQRCPETYSYTLSEGIDACVPLLVPDLGAFRERTEQRPWCWRYNVAISPRDMALLMIRIRDSIEANIAPALPKSVDEGSGVRLVSHEFFYANDYLLSSSNTG